MKVGIPKEIKDHEYRVSMAPDYVKILVQHGHTVYVETLAGEGSGYSDNDYKNAGAIILQTVSEVFQESDMIVKVKEPQPNECRMLRKGQIIFTYLHLASDWEQTKLLMESGCAAIAYETITDPQGTLPLLTPMSQIAGRIAVQAGAHCLQKSHQGSGVLLGGVPGVAPGHITIIGAGVVGGNSLQIAIGMGARVTVIDKNIKRLQELENQYFGKIETLYATPFNIERAVADSDLVIGAVLVPGGKAPKVVTREMIKKMRKGSVLVDVAIDQGGCFETSRPTTHSNSTYIEEGIVHYCVTNMPGVCSRTSTQALNNVTFPFALQLANKGLAALDDDPHFAKGLNVLDGKVTLKEVAETFNLPLE